MKSYMEYISIERIPKGHWNNKENHKKFAEALAKYKDYKNLEDWYNLTKKDIIKFGGSGFLGPHYDGSPIKFITAIHPSLKTYMFNTKLKGYWNDINNCRTYIEYLTNKLGFISKENYYNLRTEHFKENKGVGLLDKYDNCIYLILKNTFPEITWYPWLFTITVMSTWNDIENHKLYIKWIEPIIGITNWEDWYKQDGNTIKKNYGIGLLCNQYNSSLYLLLKTVYPSYLWKFYKFNKASHKVWENKENRLEYLTDLFKYKDYNNIEDWYNISSNDFKSFYGNGLIDRYNGYINCLLENIDYNFDITKFHARGYSKIGCEFLNKLSKSILVNIRHQLNGGEYRIPEMNRNSADGYIESYKELSKIIIEFHGCLFHGCPKCCKDMTKKNHYKKEFNELLSKTIERTKTLRKHGYIVVEMWECQYKITTDLRKWLETNLLPEIQNEDRTPVFISSIDELYDEHIRVYECSLEEDHKN